MTRSPMCFRQLIAENSPRFRTNAYEIHRQWKSKPEKAFPTVFAYEEQHSNDATSKSSTKNKSTRMTSGGRRAARRPRDQSAMSGMDLTYVTERMIALWFPGDLPHSAFIAGHQEAATMLQGKHPDNYMVFNLSEPRRSVRSHHDRVTELGWPPDLAPSLERLCTVCKQIDSWLAGNPARIAVLHARGNKERIGVVVAAFAHYSDICGGPDQALDRFAMRRFLDSKIGDLEQPSNRRYVDYMAGLLSANIRVNSAPLFLTHVTVLGAPAFEPGMGGGCRAFLKVYEGLVPVYTSGVYTVTGDTKQFTVNVAAERQRRGLQLRGDILLKCYHRHYSGNQRDSGTADSPTRCSSNASEPLPPLREQIFSCQFHTCAITDYTVSFTRQELDSACHDLRFPLDGAVELHFSATPESVRLPAPAPTPAVPVDLSTDPVTRWDSYENLADSPLGDTADTDTEDTADGEVCHTSGPLDGSLYATVGKKGGLISGQQRSSSMDSGISSAGNVLNTTGSQNNASASNASSSPPGADADQHRQLEELLSNMLLTVENIPDLPDLAPLPPPPAANANSRTPERPVSASPESAPDRESGIRFIDDDIPYHARQDSQPFTYGAVPNEAMLRTQIATGLSSPSLVRKASFKDSPPLPAPVITNGHGHHNDRQAPVPPRDFKRSRSSHAVASPPRSPEFHEGNVVSGSMNGTGHNLTWLQRQQLKLKERKEVQIRNERLPYETRLLSELVHHNRYKKPSPSQRLDGYTSDTTLFSGEDEEDFSIPLHINTAAGHHKQLQNGTSTPTSPVLPHRTTSRSQKQQFSAISNGNVHRQKLDTFERPFVSVKRAHEQQIKKYAENGEPSPSTGLLSVVERNGSDHLASLIATLTSHDTSSSPTWLRHQSRHESVGSLRTASISDTESSPPHTTTPRPQTPAFPVHPRTPYSNSSVHFDASSLPPKSPTSQRRAGMGKNVKKPSQNTTRSRKDWSPLAETLQRERNMMSARSYDSSSETHSPKSPALTSLQNGSTGHSSPSVYFGTSRRSSTHSNSETTHEVSRANVNFVRDTSKYWYKPNMSREEAIAMLRDKPPGTFIVRDSNSFPGAFGLVLKVATPPPGSVNKTPNSDPSNELVRHFLIEPTPRGVRLKGCANEPVFGSLSALVYQHSIMPLALPCQLVLPEMNPASSVVDGSNTISSAQLLLANGAACNVLYLVTVETESLTGPQAIVRGIGALFSMNPLPRATVVHFKVSSHGITLTDNKRRLFFRRHYPVNTISYCGLDPGDHRWSQQNDTTGLPTSSNRCFGFIARKPASQTDNECHIFAELEPEQPATAIVNFVCKVMMNSNLKPNIV
ncbi:tensin-3 isoform X1 [Bemisia tabaci]|uniref:tensin-3 isoform X1 n=1 Tax=Bemisia tabaci TaxID=7038 RepID=UPI003B289F44